MTNWMYDNMVKFLERDPNNELAVIWFARDEADWVCFMDEDEDDPNAKFTDDEWAEIAGRFNEMDWQWVSEQFQEICDDVLKERKPCKAGRSGVLWLMASGGSKRMESLAYTILNVRQSKMLLTLTQCVRRVIHPIK